MSEPLRNGVLIFNESPVCNTIVSESYLMDPSVLRFGYINEYGVTLVISTITICNQASTAGTFRIAVRPAGATLAAQHYIAYDTPIAANDTIALTLGLTLDYAAAGDVVTVYASSANLSFNLFGTEIA